MNYIKEIKAFEKWVETHHLSDLSQLLWYKLMFMANESGWSEWVTVDNLTLMAKIQKRREATFIKNRDELIQAGLIEYKRGKKGVPNKYRIISFCSKNESESEAENKLTFKNEVQSEVETVVESEAQTVDLYKHKQKHKQINSCSPANEPDEREINFGKIYEIYPKKRGKEKAYEYYLGWLKGRTICGRKIKLDNRQIFMAVENYVVQCEEEGIELRFYKNFDTFMNKTILDYLEEE